MKPVTFVVKLGMAVSLMHLGGSMPKAVAQLEVKVDGGTVRGTQKASIRIFKAIPYAAPPIGQQRWKPPEPVVAWKGTRPADTFSPSCMQTISGDFGPWTKEFLTHGAVSEDCLYLNVWTLAKVRTARLPVFVFIHGGGFISGSASVPVYDGEGLANMGLVVVTINYRLGVPGFLAHPELTAESPHHASGNYGLMDQIAALQWVRGNIANFGGDPSRVTIAGQSAGGMAVQDLMASPLAHGLFQRAIIESGGASAAHTGLNVSTSTLAAAEAAGVDYAKSVGAHSLAELRAMRWEQLNSKPSRFKPIIDGYVLPLPILTAFAEGKQNDVPTLTGQNTGELNGFLGMDPTPTTVSAFQTEARQQYGDSAGDFLKLYPATTDSEVQEKQADSAKDAAQVGMYVWAKDRGATAKGKSYLYLWNHTLPGPASARWGAFHTSEVPYVLHTLNMSDRPFTAEDHAVENTMSSYWANFAATGDPNGPGLAKWPAFDGTAQVMQLGDQDGPIPLTSTPKRFDFFVKVDTAQ